MSLTVCCVRATRSVGSKSYCLRPCSMREKSRTFSMRDGEAAAFLDDEAEVFVLLGGFGDFAPLQALSHQADRGDGRAQLVGDAGDEVGLELVEAQLALEGAPGGEHADQRARKPPRPPTPPAAAPGGGRPRTAARGRPSKAQHEARAAGQAFPSTSGPSGRFGAGRGWTDRPPASARSKGAELVPRAR